MPKAIIQIIQPYEFDDEKTGELKSGNTVWLYTSQPATNPQANGIPVSKMGVSDQLAEQIRKIKLPALFDVTFDIKSSISGKSGVMLSDAKMIASLPVDQIFSMTHKPA